MGRRKSHRFFREILRLTLVRVLLLSPTMIRVGLLFVLAGCATSSVIPDVSADSDAGAPDAASPDAGPPDAGRTDGLGACVPPDARLGSGVGQTFGRLELQRCDGTPYDFHGPEGFCSAPLTVIVIDAGWCSPSRVESARLEAEIADRYAAAGVRVVQVLVQDDHYAVPSPEFCAEWASIYGYEDVVLVTDPFGATQRYYPSSVLPTHLLVDDTATIRYYGDGLASFDALPLHIDALLAER